MHPRAVALIEQLQLAPHPEGGYFREIHRSSEQVQPADPRPPRCALTSIYFLLAEGTCSRWHRVLSDEVWHLYEGGPVDLLLADAGVHAYQELVLGEVSCGSAPVHTVPARCWQAARPRSSFALMGCSVAPGFEFADFAFLSDFPVEAARLRQHRPQWTALL